MTDQWQELKETITEMRDNDGTGTQQEVCKFLVNYMGILEKQMQEPCEMTAEEYRQRMIQAFHNANTDELIALCVLPTEKEFEHLEWLLKTHYKKEPCKDAISRQAVLDIVDSYSESQSNVEDVTQDMISDIIALPPVNSQPQTGRWIYGEDNLGTGRDGWYCNQCGHFEFWDYSSDVKSAKLNLPNPCPNCGAKMIEPQESEG